jgi:hypothetical protein
MKSSYLCEIFQTDATRRRLRGLGGRTLKYGLQAIGVKGTWQQVVDGSALGRQAAARQSGHKTRQRAWRTPPPGPPQW